MPLKLVFACAGYLTAVVLWRGFICRGGFVWHLQELIHACPQPMDTLLQWYSFAAFGITLMMLFTTGVNVRLLFAHWLSDDMPKWLREMSKAGFAFGLLAYGLLMSHFLHNVVEGSRWRKSRGQIYPEVPSKRQDLVLLVIFVPAIYIVMSLQSMARMWMVLNKSYGPFGEKIDLALYDENLDMAACCQYYAVFVFSRLTHDFVDERASGETRQIIRRAGFQGVHAWVAVGAVDMMLSWAKTYTTAHCHDDALMERACTWLPHLQKAEESVHNASALTTLLCIYNMFLICNFKPVKEALGNPTLKFSGTRALILLAMFQPRVLASPPVRELLDLDDNTAKLLHVSLLLYECLGLIAFNIVSWEFGPRQHLIFDARTHQERMFAGDSRKSLYPEDPLLDDDDDATCCGE